MRLRKIRTFTWLLPVLTVFLMSSCRKDNLKPGVPAFIHVDSIGLTTSYPEQGSNSHKITDVWVYANDQTIGVFELPATIPVLLDGKYRLRLEAGIELNGISTTRTSDPFYAPVIIDDFDFVPDSIITVNPVTQYLETVHFVWLEDFEDPSLSLDTNNLSGNTGIHRAGGDLAFEGEYSGQILLDSIHNIFEAASFDDVLLPTTSRVMLEMNYRNDIPFVMGIFEQTSAQILKKEVIYLNPSEEWNKIYINLTDWIRHAGEGTTFKIFYRSAVTGDQQGWIYLDNIKLMYR